MTKANGMTDRTPAAKMREAAAKSAAIKSLSSSEAAAILALPLPPPEPAEPIPLAAALADFARDQRPLDEDMSAAVFANVEELYELDYVPDEPAQPITLADALAVPEIAGMVEAAGQFERAIGMPNVELGRLRVRLSDALAALTKEPKT